MRGGPRVFQLAISLLDSSGSQTFIDRDLFVPLRQLVLAGDEDGELDFLPASRKLEASAQELRELALARKVEETVKASDVLVEDLSELFRKVNQEGRLKVF